MRDLDLDLREGYDYFGETRSAHLLLSSVRLILAYLDRLCKMCDVWHVQGPKNWEMGADDVGEPFTSPTASPSAYSRGGGVGGGKAKRPMGGAGDGTGIVCAKGQPRRVGEVSMELITSVPLAASAAGVAKSSTAARTAPGKAEPLPITVAASGTPGAASQPRVMDPHPPASGIDRTYVQEWCHSTA